MKIFEIFFIGLTAVVALCLSAPISTESSDESSSPESPEDAIASIASDFLTIHLSQTGDETEDNERIVDVDDHFVEYDEVVSVIISAFPVEFEVVSGESHLPTSIFETETQFLKNFQMSMSSPTVPTMSHLSKRSREPLLFLMEKQVSLQSTATARTMWKSQAFSMIRQL